MKIKGGGCACNCRGFDPNESKCDCYGRQKPICNVGGRRACGNGKFVASCYSDFAKVGLDQNNNSSNCDDINILQNNNNTINFDNDLDQINIKLVDPLGISKFNYENLDKAREFFDKWCANKSIRYIPPQALFGWENFLVPDDNFPTGFWVLGEFDDDENIKQYIKLDLNFKEDRDNLIFKSISGDDFIKWFNDSGCMLVKVIASFIATNSNGDVVQGDGVWGFRESRNRNQNLRLYKY